MSRIRIVGTLSALLAGTCAAAASDQPVSSDGSRAAAIGAAGRATIAPTVGDASSSRESLVEAGANFLPEATFPTDGLGSVAYGSVGKRGRSVINWDSRRRVYTNAYPSRAIVFIELNGQHHCTGWMYAANMVATAGHCVHTGGSSGTWYNRTQMRVYPGRDGSASPYGFCTVSRLHSVTGWTQSKNFRFDYGAMRLNCTVGTRVGTFGMYTSESLLNTPAIISGYPGDKPRDQWTSSDKIRSVSPEMIGYRMDTVGGHSGSPVWHDRDEALATSGAWVIGVHNYGVGAFGTQMNAAARLTQARINNYVSWRNQP